jgi:hypothetical protein
MALVGHQRAPTVAKKQTARAEEPAPESGIERIEFQAPIGWTKKIDAAAKAVGLSRSAYIRQAVALQIRRDKGD